MENLTHFEIIFADGQGSLTIEANEWIHDPLTHSFKFKRDGDIAILVPVSQVLYISNADSKEGLITLSLGFDRGNARKGFDHGNARSGTTDGGGRSENSDGGDRVGNG